MNSNEGSSSERLAADLRRVVRDSEDLLKDSAGVVGEKAHELRERLAERLEMAKEAYQRFEARAREGAKATDKVIREHPYQSIGIAFGVGVLIGVLVSRR